MTMQHYDFTLKFALPSHEADPGLFVERLLSEGCDDALVGTGQRGRIALNFTRASASAEEAVLSALSDVRRTIPGARLIEASPDLVGLTDIAYLLGFSRQYMRKLVVQSGAEFPLPVHDGKPAIWHLSSILTWLQGKKAREVDQALLEIAHINMQCNLLKEAAGLDSEIARRLKMLVA